MTAKISAVFLILLTTHHYSVNILVFRSTLEELRNEFLVASSLVKFIAGK